MTGEECKEILKLKMVVFECWNCSGVFLFLHFRGFKNIEYLVYSIMENICVFVCFLL